MNKTLVSAGLLGASAIALGAFGAHGLDDQLQSIGFEGEDLQHRIDVFTTASRYQLIGATALLAIGLISTEQRTWRVFVGLLTSGILIFSGLLYVLAFAGESFRWLGVIVPLGGLAMIGAWAFVTWRGLTESELGSGSSQSEPDPSQENLIRVEELLSHQQHLLNELNEVVTSVRQEVDSRDTRIHTIENTVKRLVEFQQAAEDLPDERPPHY